MIARIFRPNTDPPCDSLLLPVRETPSGEWLNAVVCDARPQFDIDGTPKRHRGKHRAKLGRIRVRWTDAEAHSVP